MTPMRADVVIVGGGIVGCAIAWYLARDGVSVTLLERGRIGHGASDAAAGMLAPMCEAKKAGPFADLLVAALRDYPEAARDAEVAGGLPTGYRQCGILRVAFTEDEEARLENALSLYAGAGLPYRRLTTEEARREEPALSAEMRAAVLSPEEGQAIPREIVQAFRRAAEARGARIHEYTEVTGLEMAGGVAGGVRVNGGVFAANTVVLAAGAWSSLFSEMLPAPVSVFPVRGQVVALRNLPVPVRRVIYSYAGYAVPWPDGRLILGATQEEAGYAARTTVEGVTQVLAGAARLLPGIREAEIDAMWAGLRPGSADGRPLLGPAPGCENVWLATGHFRNGILLGPYTARLVAESIQSGGVLPALEPFLPDRSA
jgi:glycine oxidase